MQPYPRQCAENHGSFCEGEEVRISSVLLLCLEDAALAEAMDK
jgi:hypothetical protein